MHSGEAPDAADKALRSCRRKLVKSKGPEAGSSERRGAQPPQGPPCSLQVTPPARQTPTAWQTLGETSRGVAPPAESAHRTGGIITRLF